MQVKKKTLSKPQPNLDTRLGLTITRLKSKVFSLERLYKVCVQKNFGSEKKLGQKKNFGLNKKKFGSEKILGPKRFWFKIFLGTNKISGLKILGLKKILGLGQKFWVRKKNLTRNSRPNKFWVRKKCLKKLWVQKKF